MIQQLRLNHPVLSDDAGACPATVTCSFLGVRLVGCLFFMKMPELSFGVACGAKGLLYLILETICSCHFWFWDARRGNKLEHFHQDLMQIIESEN